ncbi:MAG: sodium:calcium antiporter [Deltaproteobacteria bacterium]|nr:sodium:calcium antiporter [Deltaproteobacteria bacterium]
MGHTILHWIGDEAVLIGFVAGFPTWLLLILIVFCIMVLSRGADVMIGGAVHLARRTGLPHIVIGATIVSLGTTMPEAFISVMAAWMGNPGLALGNGIGSIIADTGLIFGLSCMLTIMPVNRFILNRTGWVQVGSATLLVVISLILMVTMEGRIILGRWVGFLFLILLVGYLYITYTWARQGAFPEKNKKPDSSPVGLVPASFMVAGGLFFVILAARILIPCAAEIATRIGVPEDVVAATMVALGTSLPELMTAIAAVRKGHPEISVGNIVGADVLNCLFVIGAAAAAKPLAIPINFFVFHFPTMLLILFSFRFFIFINTDGQFKRRQGAWLFGIYLIYVVLQYTMNIGTAV